MSIILPSVLATDSLLRVIEIILPVRLHLSPPIPFETR